MTSSLLSDAADFVSVVNSGGTIVAHPDTLKSFKYRKDCPNVLMMLALAFVNDKLIANEIFEPGRLFAVPSLESAGPRVVRSLEVS